MRQAATLAGGLSTNAVSAPASAGGARSSASRISTQRCLKGRLCSAELRWLAKSSNLRDVTRAPRLAATAAVQSVEYESNTCTSSHHCTESRQPGRSSSSFFVRISTEIGGRADGPAAALIAE